MQVTLNVEGSQLDNEVRSLLSNLSDEQKQSLALQLLQNTVENTKSSLMIEKIAEDICAEHNNKETDKHKHATWKDGEFVQKTPSSYYSNLEYSIRDNLKLELKARAYARNFFKEDVLKELYSLAKSQTEEVVKNSPEITKAISDTVQVIKDQLPKMVHDAMLMYFCTQMESLTKSVASSMFQSNNQQLVLQELQKSLSEKGLS